MGRVTGTESEYSPTMRFNDDRVDGFSDPTEARIFETHFPPDVGRLKEFCQNGARCYVDNTLPEYATPEDDNILGTIANEYVGERIVRTAMQRAVAAGAIKGFGLHKRVISGRAALGTNAHAGYHVSYATEGQAIGIHDGYLNPDSLGLFALHAATRGLFAGAGAWVTNHLYDEGRFVISQKTLYTNMDFASGTTGTHTPLVNIRNEPLADERFKRFHDVSGDANMSPWATMMNIGTSSLVLALLERGIGLEQLRTEHAAFHLARQVSNDLSLSKTVDLQNGRTIRPLDMQGEIMTAARDKLPSLMDLSETDKIVLDQWEYALDTLAQDPDRLHDRVEWVGRREFLETYRARRGTDATDKRLLEVDLFWDSLDPVRSVGLKHRDGRWRQWMPDAALLAERMALRPPQTTRAKLRGAFVSWVLREASQDTAVVKWDKLVPPVRLGVNHEGINLPDPYQTECPELATIVGDIL